MKTPLRLLHIDDNPIDVRLAQAYLAAAGIACDVIRVDTTAALEVALQQGGFDLVLSDVVLTGLDTLQALALVQRLCPGVPFIAFSGTTSDTVAGKLLTGGAAAYLPKDCLSDLPHSIERALSDGHVPAIPRI